MGIDKSHIVLKQNCMKSISKTEMITIQSLTVLGLLFMITATVLFGIMIAAHHLQFSPPTWLGTQDDATQYINISYWLFFGCMIISMFYWRIFIMPFPGRDRVTIRTSR